MPLSEQERPCFFKIQVSKLDAAAASAVVRRTVRPGSEIRSDALRSFRAALREGYTHHYQVFDKDSGALHWVYTLISNLKAFLRGMYHDLGKKYLQSYFEACHSYGRFQHLGL